MFEIQSEFSLSPTSGEYYIFYNKRTNLMKVLFWDGLGIIVCSKRLERPAKSYLKSYGKELSPSDFLQLMNEGPQKKYN